MNKEDEKKISSNLVPKESDRCIICLHFWKRTSDMSPPLTQIGEIKVRIKDRNYHGEWCFGTEQINVTLRDKHYQSLIDELKETKYTGYLYNHFNDFDGKRVECDGVMIRYNENTKLFNFGCQRTQTYVLDLSKEFIFTFATEKDREKMFAYGLPSLSDVIGNSSNKK
jgi:hypothetical protein